MCLTYHTPAAPARTGKLGRWSSAWKHGRSRVDDDALPKSAKSESLRPSESVIRGMSAKLSELIRMHTRKDAHCRSATGFLSPAIWVRGEV